MAWGKRFSTSVALAAILLASSAATARHVVVTRAASDAKTLFVANYEWDPSYDPGTQYGQVAPVVFRNAYDSLVRLKGSSTSVYQGDLATSWTSNAAKTVWTFTLRHGVTFHDGTPLTAAAVQFSIDRLLTLNQGPAFILGQFMTAKSINVVNPYKIEFDLTNPAPRLLAAMSSQWANWIVSPTAIKAHTVKGDSAQAWLVNHDAGSGPYMIQSAVNGDSVTLVKFPTYWGGWSGKHVDRIVMTYVPEEQTRRELIEKGGVDLTLFFSPQNLVALQQNAQLKVDVSPGVLQELLIPTVYGPFASPLARQALAYAFDYDAMNKQFLKGFAVQSQGPIARTIYGHDSSLPVFHADLTKAKQLFTQAGVKQGATVTLWYIANDQLAKQIALITQGQLGQIGITVQIIGKDSSTVNNAQGGNEPASKRPNLWAANWFPDYSDPIDVITPLYHTKGNLGGAVNMGLYSNKQVDALLAKAAVTANAAAQQALFNQIQTILTVTDPAATYISDTSYQQVYRASLHGFYSNPTYGNTFDFYPLYK